MVRIRMDSRILLLIILLLFCDACVSDSGDVDASCDGAFDVYFVLDR